MGQGAGSIDFLILHICSSSKDSTVVLKRPRQFNLESCLDYINEDELVEVTPENIRLRKRYLTENERRQQYRKNNG